MTGGLASCSSTATGWILWQRGRVAWALRRVDLALPPLTYEERQIASSVRDAWLQEAQHEFDVFALIMKQNAEELDPRHFDRHEKDRFDETDAAERGSGSPTTRSSLSLRR